MTFVCDTCNSTFSKKAGLNNHIKTAKYCIKLRELNSIDSSASTCDICDATFTSKYNLRKHLSNCSSHPGYVKYKAIASNLQAKVELYEKQIQELRKDLKDLSIRAIDRPSTINNNSHNTNNILIANLAPWDPEQIISRVESAPMSEEIYDEGLPAIGNHYAKQQTVFQDSIMMKTSDRARKLIAHKLPNGTIVKEKNAISFIKVAQPTILDHAIPLHRKKESDYDIVTKYNKLNNTLIPNHNRFIKEAKQRLDDIRYKADDHVDKIRINKQIDQLDGELQVLIRECYQLKSEALSRHLCLSDPDFHLSKMQKSSTTLNQVKYLADSKNASAFASGLIEVFN